MHATRDTRRGRIRPPWRWAALLAMAGLAAVYVALHSPLRAVLAALAGQGSQGCYFVCGPLPLDRLAAGASAVLLLALAGLAAAALSARWPGPAYEQPLVFGLAAFGLVVVPAAALGGLASWGGGAWLRPPLGPLLVALPGSAVLTGALRQGWRPGWPRIGWAGQGALGWLLLGLAGLLLAASAALSLMHPPGGGDAVSYHAPQAVFLWQDGNLSSFLDRAPGTWALAHPASAELLFGLLRLVGGEPLADLGQLPFALLGGAAVAAFTRRLGLGADSAALAGTAFLLVPLLVVQIGMQLNDVVGAALVMAALALAGAPRGEWTARRLGLLGLGLGLVATTKLALLPAAAMLGLFALGISAWQGQQEGWARTGRGLALLGLTFLAVVAPWWMRNLVRYQNPLYPAALPVLGRGIVVSDFGRVANLDSDFVPSLAAWPLYPLLEPYDERSGFGALFAVGVLPGLLLAARRARRPPLLLYLLVVAVSLPAWWLVSPHHPRFLLPLVGPALAFLPWSLLVLPRAQRRLGALLLAGAAIFSALVTFDQALLPLARAPNTRVEFYDRVWDIDPVVEALPESDGLLLNTGYARYTYPTYYPLLGPSLARLVVPVDTDVTGDALITTMRRAGIRDAYVVAAPESVATVEAIYDPAQFDLLHSSIVQEGAFAGTRRYLFRLK